MRAFAISDLPPRMQAQLVEQLNGRASIPAPEPAPAKRLRQDSKPVLNKLETRFLEKLARDYAGELILAQAIRLELARGHWYKPDFFLPSAANRPVAYEVKGPKAFRGGFENLKVAARVHPWIKFFLVWEDQALVWQRQEILP